ncbi:MAG: carbohydrate-binding protein [Gammaproteobacteria bacterium]|nr:carbohydrate-binding protein [Gammaproteobacteria bacterium]
MRKRIIETEHPVRPEAGYLDLESLAQVEVTSEDPAHPIEAALLPGRGSGWRAAKPGKQTIRLLFDRPQSLQRIELCFEERDTARTQEYVLRWFDDSGRGGHEILRQQWNFSPGGSTREDESHRLQLAEVSALELEITPAIGECDSAMASLARLRLV